MQKDRLPDAFNGQLGKERKKVLDVLRKVNRPTKSAFLCNTNYKLSHCQFSLHTLPYPSQRALIENAPSCKKININFVQIAPKFRTVQTITS